MSKTPVRCEVFWANLEPVRGSEQGGFRPVLIISNNLMNESAPFVIGIPMTRGSEKRKITAFNIPYKLSQISIDKNAVEELSEMGHLFAAVDGIVLCNQGRTMATDRLICRVGVFVDMDVIRCVEEAIKHSYALEACNFCGIPLRTGGVTCSRCGRAYRTMCVCKAVVRLEFNFCPVCGRGLKGESSEQIRLN